MNYLQLITTFIFALFSQPATTLDSSLSILPMRTKYYQATDNYWLIKTYAGKKLIHNELKIATYVNRKHILFFQMWQYIGLLCLRDQSCLPFPPFVFSFCCPL